MKNFKVRIFGNSNKILSLMMEINLFLNATKTSSAKQGCSFYVLIKIGQFLSLQTI
jgi:hypothetical protein